MLKPQVRIQKLKSQLKEASQKNGGYVNKIEVKERSSE